ncbi:50S ribosomal protein L30 [Flagellatimonas centrodinii]|mgnify:CR=1 FL=1|uniref:50S ribosomal protein L30 n=1 Tax=Flagellatimonas centrodinii TaxID=2806210 RepID=UPI001FF04B91|nr:50S ribosomal protein L30 [Flagellatimonas centrodinii]ULQ47323.1 50S ribosomal protein L30 [Flagellatimonas centrodinii]
MSGSKQIKLTLQKSLAKRLPRHVACAHGLGLRNRHQTVTVAATPENMGMVNKVAYLLKVEEV